MKQILFFLVVCFLTSCSNETAKVESMKTNDSSQKAAVNYPYTPSYSSAFEIGDAAHSQTLLGLIKDWDNNNLDNSKGGFADSVTLMIADGTVMAGTADSIIKVSKPYRTSLGTVSSKVHAWTPLKSTDKNENWVLVWYTEYRTANGKKDSVEYQETWRFNKEGKADMMMQYLRKNPPTAKM